MKEWYPKHELGKKKLFCFKYHHKKTEYKIIKYEIFSLILEFVNIINNDKILDFSKSHFQQSSQKDKIL